jgi:hypothetical protein
LRDLKKNNASAFPRIVKVWCDFFYFLIDWIIYYGYDN